MTVYVLLNDWLTGEPTDLRSFDSFDEFEDIFLQYIGSYDCIVRMWFEVK